MSRDIIVCGLPLTEESTTDEFLKLISSDNIIGIISGGIYSDTEKQNFDYLSASHGFELLKQAGFTFVERENADIRTLVMLNCWYNNGERITGEQVAQQVRDFANSLEFDSKIVYFCPGSPYFYDRVSEKLITPTTKVIDTQSSVHICHERFKKLGVNLPMNVVEQESFTILSDHVNILCAIGEIYRECFNIHLLVNKIKDSHRCYSVKLGYDEKIIPLSTETTKYLLLNHLDAFNSNMLVIF